MTERLLTLPEMPGSIVISLSGAQGANRELALSCQIRATNDLEAIHCWLNEYRHKETTFRSYQKESERLLLWCIYQRKKALSSLDRDDIELYFDFLSDPKPTERWCAPRGNRENRRGEPGWRPFIGPLGHSAKTTAISIIHSLFNYLTAARYLAYNPFSLMRGQAKRQRQIEENKIQVVERILEMDEWEAILQTLRHLPEDTPHAIQEKYRLRLLVAILYFLGLRISEVANHHWSAFRKVQDQWWCFVIGKGGKLGKIPVNSSLLQEIIQYRTFFKLDPYPNPQEEIPLIPSWRDKGGLSPRHMHALLKDLAKKAALLFPDNPEKVKKLHKFSPHWLRHLSASMQDRAGVAFKHIKENHRHENDETTRLYVHALDAERHADMQKLTWTIS